MTQQQFGETNLDKLFVNIERFRTSSYFRDLLDMCRRFRHLSPYNAMLVNMQKPSARYVLREKEWKEQFHRIIKPNAQPLIILVPFGPVDYLFEISDTEGTDLFNSSDNDILDFLAHPYKTKNEVPHSLLNHLINCCTCHGITFDTKMNAGAGYGGKIEMLKTSTIKIRIPINKDNYIFEPASYLISINKNAGYGQQFATIAHELGHLFCRHLSAPSGWNKWQVRDISHEGKEFEAEAVSWLICERLNIGNPSEYYLSTYLGKNKHIPNGVSIEAIFHAFNNIWNMSQEGVVLYVKEGLMYKNNQQFKEIVDKRLKELKQQN